MTVSRSYLAEGILAAVPPLLYAAVVIVFAWLAPHFLSVPNFVNILVQCSAVAIAAVGMTFVLLTAGIDLSVGSVMFLASSLAGTLVIRLGWPMPVALLVMIGAGGLTGAVNGLLITRLRMAPFVVTLAMLFVARGLGLWITETRALNLPDTFRQLATARVLGVPSPVLLLLLILVTAQMLLGRTVFGRQLYAIGHNREAAEKAGIRVSLRLLQVYVLSGVCAAIGGMIILAQLAAVSPNLGQGRELDVIAAAVLGRGQPVWRARHRLGRRPGSRFGGNRTQRPEPDRRQSLHLPRHHRRYHLHRRIARYHAASTVGEAAATQDPTGLVKWRRMHHWECNSRNSVVERGQTPFAGTARRWPRGLSPSVQAMSHIDRT